MTSIEVDADVAAHARQALFEHATFMLLRDQRGKRGSSPTDDEDEQASVTQTHVHPSEVANPYHSLSSIIAIGARVQRCRMAYYPRPQRDEGVGILWMADYDSGSWARLHHDLDSDGPYPVPRAPVRAQAAVGRGRSRPRLVDRPRQARHRPLADHGDPRRSADRTGPLLIRYSGTVTTV